MVTTLDFLHNPFANLFWKCEVRVGVSLGGHDVGRKCVRSDFRVHECREVSNDHKFTQLRALLYVVTTLYFLHSPYANLLCKCEERVGVGWVGHDVSRKCFISGFESP